MNIQNLEQILEYSFVNKQLIKLALTHRSASSEHNERLEFIGDGLVNLIIGEALFHRYPQAPEGELSRWRAALVQRETLAQIAQTWQLEQFITLGPGEQKTDGAKRPSILANTVEAIFGAIYFDSGFSNIQQFILKIFANKLSMSAILTIQKDAKTQLQEYLQSNQLPLPTYEVIHTTGQEHENIFTISCKIKTLSLEAHGQGHNKKQAEQAAAKKVLALISNSSASNPPKK